MGGVALGDTQTQVRRVVGHPDRVELFGASHGGHSTYVWHVKARSLTVELMDRRVTRVETASRRYRTPDGIRVGSSLSRLKRLHHVLCDDETRECFTGTGALGSPQTVFRSKGGRLTLIRVVTVTP